MIMADSPPPVLALLTVLVWFQHPGCQILYRLQWVLPLIREGRSIEQAHPHLEILTARYLLSVVIRVNYSKRHAVLSGELLLLPAIIVMFQPLLVKISSVEHMRTLCPCPKEDCVTEVSASQTISGLSVVEAAHCSCLAFK